MSEQVLEQTEKKSLKSPALAVRFSQPKYGMFGIPEIAGLALSGLFVLLVIISYFYFLLPAQSRLKNLNDEKLQLQNSIKNLGDTVNKNQTVEQNIADINDSVVKFERNHLRQPSTGKMSLYEELNEAIRRNGLRNTDGPTYTALDAIDPDAPKSQTTKAGIAKFQSLFPGINVTVTVEGSYANQRRFIREIEANNQFVIINAVQLEGQEKADSAAEIDNSGGMKGNPMTPQSAGQTKSSIYVSLRLEMAVYFQRNAGIQE